MSLINKMLQDLDARGNGAAPLQDEVKAVPVAERDRRPLLLGGVALGALVLAGAGWYGWRYWQAHSAPPPPVAQAVDERIPDQARKQPPPVSITPAEQAGAAVPTPAPAPAQAAAPAPAETPPAVAPAPALAAADTAPPAVAKPKHVAQSARTDEVKSEDAGMASPTPAAAAPAPTRKSARTAAAAPAATGDGVVLRELTPKQISDNSYRRALLALQEGRVSSALSELDKAVEIDPRNDAARQTYVSLLLENKRNDDAIRQLRLALGIDPRQPGLAMVLARLQLEKGDSALDTLLKTLPYALNNADYQAFLAGVLQREQRHAEAAQHYRDALQLSPQNGVWWMGLGISLQADQHLPEAREAYNRARASGGMTPELRAFIERKIDQLSR